MSGMEQIINYIDKDSILIADAVESDQNWKRFSRQHPANQYKGIMHRLSLHRTGPHNQHKTILLDRTHIVIPKLARQNILSSLHTAHSGMTKTYKIARQLYYWPGMKANIASSIDACMACQTNKALLPRPVLKHTASPRTMTPMRHIAMDLFDALGKKWLVMVDRFSGYAWLGQLKSTTTAKILETIMLGSMAMDGLTTFVPTEGHNSNKNLTNFVLTTA